MKTFLSLFTLYLSFSQVSALVAEQVEIYNRYIETRNSSSNATCTNTTHVPVRFRRAWKSSTGDHFYSTNMSEIQDNVKFDGGAPYQFQTDAALVFTEQQPGTVEFYRYYSSAKDDHLYSTSNDSAPGSDYTLEGTACYVYPSPICGSVPLFELYTVAASDSAYTVNETEKIGWEVYGGYVNKPIAAYVLRP